MAARVVLFRPAQAEPGSVALRALTSAFVSRLIGRSYAGACLVFGALLVAPAFRDQPAMNPIWAWVFGLLLFLSLAISVVTGFRLRRLRAIAAVASLVYAAMVVSWPLAVTDPQIVLRHAPWIWGACNVAMAAAVIGLPPVSAGVYICALSIIWALVRLTPAGGAAGIQRALLDAGYAYLLGMAIMVIILYLRRGADVVDDRQRSAVARYAKATKDHETEKQRMAVDALLHDNVMSTLLHVSSAETREERLVSARMAITSLNVIADSEDHLDRQHAPVTATEIRHRFEHLQNELGAPITLRITGPEQHDIPWTVAESLFAAALQALVNSVQHGGDTVTYRTVTVSWTQSCVTVTIADDGVGFDPTADTTRMGVRVSIIERMNAVGGSATIDSGTGQGTRITLTWTDPHQQLPPETGTVKAAPAPHENAMEASGSAARGWAALTAGGLSATVGTLLLAHIAALPLAVFASLAQVTLFVMLAYDTTHLPRASRFALGVLFSLAGASQAIRGTAFLISPALHDSLILTIVGAAGCGCAITGLAAQRRTQRRTRFATTLLVGAMTGFVGFVYSAMGGAPRVAVTVLVLASTCQIIASLTVLLPHLAPRRRHI